MEKAIVIAVHKVKGMGSAEAVRNVYKALNGLSVSNVEVAEIPQEWFGRNAADGWNVEVLVKNINPAVEKLTSIEGHPLNELFMELQGVTTGGNKFFVFDLNELVRLEKKGYKLFKSGLLYKCISGGDVKPWSITFRRRVLVPYVVGVDKRTGRQVWLPAFATKKGDALDFTKTLASEESLEEDISTRLNKRIMDGIISSELASVAKYLVNHYENLKNRVYEGRKIEEYAGVWYGFHRPRSPEITKTPNIVTPRVVKEPRFALNKDRAIPLDSVIVLIPKERKLDELKRELERVLGRDISAEDVLIYVVGIMNSKISHIILKARATKIRGGYCTIDERYLSSVVIPRHEADDRSLLGEIFEAVKISRWDKVDDLIVRLYSKHASLSKEDIKHLLDLV